eukprot:3620618-Prymnesium_polylepis.3
MVDWMRGATEAPCSLLLYGARCRRACELLVPRRIHVCSEARDGEGQRGIMHRAVDLYCGIGGWTVGAERAGFEVKARGGAGR